MFLLGLSPYTYHSGKFKLNKIGFFIPLFYLLLFFGFTVSSHLRKLSTTVTFTNAEVSTFAEQVFEVFGVICVPLILLNAMIHRHTFIELFYKIFELEMALKRIALFIDPGDFKRLRRRWIVFLTGFGVIYAAFCFWMSISHELFSSYEDYIAFLMPKLYSHFTGLLFLNFCIRFKHLIRTQNKVS